MERFGCYYVIPCPSGTRREYLPHLKHRVHATLLSSSSRTVITQTFVNRSATHTIPEVIYTFPLYDGVSVVDFTCHIRDTVLQGQVKPRDEASKIYEEAKSKGQTAAALHQSTSAADVFMTQLGNLPPNGQVVITIALLGELKQDAQADGIRYTLPHKVNPRYGKRDDDLPPPSHVMQETDSIEVDVIMGKGVVIRGIQSPSHPLKVELGRASYMPKSTFDPCYASASLHISGGQVKVEDDFVLIVNADNQDTPFALLETHPKLPNQRALMVSLVPKFGLPPASPEIVFVIDRSGSMRDKIATLKSALKVFLKSLPLGVYFNIISFGSNHSSLWRQSKAYDQNSLSKALQFVDTIESNMGGTEILAPLGAAVQARYKDKDLEVLLLTDGEVWDQQSVFDFVGKAATESPIRFFSLAIGDSASHALIEGVARAGKGFSQSVTNYEELDRKVIRMLKGALMPHIDNYALDLHLTAVERDDYEFIDPVNTKTPSVCTDETLTPSIPEIPRQPISLYDSEYKDSDKITGPEKDQALPKINIPAAIQSPTEIPPLYPFIRSTVYILFSEKMLEYPDKITLRADSKHGPLSLEIPVLDVGQGETIHQLAARKAMIELDEGRGWMKQAKDEHGNLIREKWESRMRELAITESQRLGTSFRVAGAHCSFVAVDAVHGEVQSESSYETCTEVRSPVLVNFATRKMRALAFQEMNSQPCRLAAPDLDMAQMQLDSISNKGGFGIARRLRKSLTSSSTSRLSDPLASAEGFGAFGPLKSSKGSPSPPKPSPMVSASSPSPQNMAQDSPVGKVHAIIAMQAFDGPWNWSDALLKALDMEPGKVEADIQRLYKEASGKEIVGFHKSPLATIFVTSLVLSFLEKKTPDLRDLWELVKAKADGWVDSTVGGMDQNDQEIVRRVIKGLVSMYT